ncbi:MULTISPECIES: RES family NAD+ phosphorylase [Flagellimonas]|uniref:RES domain-containing protein n=1 Tax=Flagellimonas olearia TaxID=552546 RepID=A0A444VI16_9FLAO|nr:RES family NAD+ phosphorylase [Allomuricauda olearia]RYC50408.1 hypothetical protein DN53_05670 [Allomuricauda olearia]
MIVYRLGKQRFIEDLSGSGAYMNGGRWNNKGVYMLYTSESKALAMSELSVHLPLGIVPKDYSFVKMEIPDDKILELDMKLLDPIDWKTLPHGPETQAIGDQFILDNTHLALKVPSVVVEGDFNYVLNPHFPDYNRLVTIIDKGPFPFDQRIFVRPNTN